MFFKVASSKWKRYTKEWHLPLSGDVALSPALGVTSTGQVNQSVSKIITEKASPSFWDMSLPSGYALISRRLKFKNEIFKRTKHIALAGLRKEHTWYARYLQHLRECRVGCMVLDPNASAGDHVLSRGLWPGQQKDCCWVNRGQLWSFYLPGTSLNTSANSSTLSKSI